MPNTEAYSRRMTLLDGQIKRSLESLEGSSELMTQMGQYSLGLVDTQGDPTEEETRKRVQGKRIRPQIAMMVAEAIGESTEAAAPLAAAIELLHNFTLIHDDIQDRSPNRRHRPTVWRVWGNAQAINAGDALFALAQLSILDEAANVPPGVMISLLEGFNRCTIDIVRGQVQDLNYEGSGSVTPADYLEMISGKTAAIIRYSAWAGAMIGGASIELAERLGEMGHAIGMGFQIRDDILGIWSPSEETGKNAADDLRRRKQTLPVLILRASADETDTERIQQLYAQEEIGDQQIDELLALLDKYDVQEQTAKHANTEHESAIRILDHVFGDASDPAVGELRALIMQLVNRTF